MSGLTAPRKLTIVGLVALLAAAPFVPRGGDDDDGAITPSVQQRWLPRTAEAVGWGRISADDAAEIDRVVGTGLTLGRRLAGTVDRVAPDGVLGRAALSSGAIDARRVVDTVVRCAEFSGQRYCLGTGWTDRTERQVQTDALRSVEQVLARRAPVQQTGDLDAAASLARLASMTPVARAARERAELRQAARSVAKVWMLRHEIQGTPLPAGFLANHPEARAEARTVTTDRAAKPTASPTASPTKNPTKAPTKSPTKAPTKSPTTSPSPTKSPTKSPTSSATPTATASSKPLESYPRKRVVLDPSEVAEQVRTYWCGPTTMQMIAWGWSGRDAGAATWAEKLGTTSSGTAITDMVRVVNRHTGWDDEEHAGPYIVLDISDWTYRQWVTLIARHVADYRAPVVMHPILLKKYFPYLDDDGSGHFQAGRGYHRPQDGPVLISYFEPWNQQRFDPSEPFIERVQWQSAYRSYRANLAHFQHNIGV